MTDASMNVFPMNLVHIGNLILFAHQFCRYVEHLLQGEICCIHNGILIVLEILSHECRCMHRHSHKHPPNYWMFLSWACNAGHSFLSFSHLMIYFLHKFCCITSHDEICGMCLLLESWYYQVSPDQSRSIVSIIIRLPRSIWNTRNISKNRNN